MARKRAHYLILDCETATLPFVKEMEGLLPAERQKISIAKPLVYDIGWTIIDRQGNFIKKVSYLVQETFFVPNIFNTAYYREKRPMYMQKLAQNLIKPKLWNDIIPELLADCRTCNYVCAYNAMFDFKKAIPFTETYIKHLYSDNYNKWEYAQRKSVKEILRNEKEKNPNFDAEHFILREEKFPVVDLWHVASKELVNKFIYILACGELPMISNSGLYFKTSAESVFRYLDEDYTFEEEHTALADAEIESKILLTAFRRNRPIEKGIKPFPFQELGTTYDWLIEAVEHTKGKNKVTQQAISNIIDVMETYLQGKQSEKNYTSFGISLYCKKNDLIQLQNRKFGTNREDATPYYIQMCEIQRKKNAIQNAKDAETREKWKKELLALENELNRMMFEKEQEN
jgi:hypothetical protein